jgi:hypothetical protein
VLQHREPGEIARALLDPQRPPDDPVVQAVHLLMSGFGYNFYDARNVARANDQRVRAAAAGLLADGGRLMARLAFAYREAHVPPATREQPYPPAEALAALKQWEKLERRLAEVETRLRSLETPQHDAIWFRLRDERARLERLLAFDVGLVATASDLARSIAALDAEAIHVRRTAELSAEIERLDRTIDARQALMSLSG